MPEAPSGVLALPHFTPTGPPEFIADSVGVLAGLRLETPRGEVLKGLLEGANYYLRELVDSLGGAGIEIADFRAVGGGSKSDAWLQLSADIYARPVVRPAVTEAGAFGAAIIAGAGAGVFDSMEQAAEAMVTLEATFEPDSARQSLHERRYEQYRKLWPLMKDYLRKIAKPLG